jgi:Zn-dependent protease
MHFIDFIQKVVIIYPILLFSIIIHEMSHGWMAERFGDDTARVMGRLTFNPMPHIDVLGTVVLPIIGLWTGFLFGWAKPVPVNPYRLNNPKRDMMWVGLAGPASNVLLALAAAFLMWFFRSYDIFPAWLASSVNTLSFIILEINIFLFIFNLIPVPPLDGSRVVTAILPPALAYRYASLENYGMVIVLLLFMTGIVTSVLSPIINFLIFFLSGGKALL